MSFPVISIFINFQLFHPFYHIPVSSIPLLQVLSLSNKKSIQPFSAEIFSEMSSEEYSVLYKWGKTKVVGGEIQVALVFTRFRIYFYRQTAEK